MRRWAFLFCIVAAFLLAADPIEATNSKKGVGYTGGDPDLVADMGASWVRTWGITGGPWEGTGIRFFPTIERVPLVAGVVPESYLQELRVEARRNPGTCWIYGNEPDGTDPGSDPWSPQEAMVAWPQAYQAVMEVDPTACWIFGNVIWESYLDYSGSWWLEECLAIEPGLRSQVDGWGLHLYAEMVVEPWEWWEACPPDYECVRERDLLDRYEASVGRAVEWASTAGGGLPIWFTEWGQLRDLCQEFTCPDPEEPGAECRSDLTCDYREALIRRIVPYFDREPMVAGYAWFATMTTDLIRLPSGGVVEGCASWCPCCDSPLVDGAGLTDLGEAHARPYRQRFPLLFSHFGSPLH